MKFYTDALIVLGSFILVFVWQNSQLAQYSIPFVGFLVFLFLLISFKRKQNLNLGGPVNFFILNTILLLFIFSTGGIESNLFFLIYFLLFAAAFIMDPRSVFIIPIGLIIIFWSQIFQGDVGANIIKVASISILSPLAYFFGIQFKKNDKAADEILKTKERASSSADEISSDVKEVIESGKSKLNPKELGKLKEILDETKDLREEKK
ncbi:MAG: hypothetical protein KBD51_02010 [Candidatus Levybacteria bacterium]|nr:hypothetical protein [Candidatus Levybacteria bacterium]